MPSTGKGAPGAGGTGEDAIGSPRKTDSSSGNIIRPRSFTAPPPDPAEALYYEGMAAYQHRNWTQALERFSKLKEVQPGRPGLDALLDEVRWFLQLQAAGPAAATSTEAAAPGRALGTGETHLGPWRKVGLVLLALVAVAALLLVAFGGKLPWNSAANRETQELYARAETRLAVGDYEGAQAVFQKLLELSPGDPEAQLGLDRAQRQQLLAQGYAAAEAAIAEENWEQATVELANVLAIDPHYADAQAKAELVAQRRRLASLYADGSRLYDLAQWQDAATQFERIRELDGTYREEAVAEFLFVCYLNAGEEAVVQAGLDLPAVERAIDFYGRALAIHPRNRIATDAYRLGNLYLLAVQALTQGDRAQARGQFEALLAEDPNYADGQAAQHLYALLVEMGRAQAGAGDIRGALDLFRQAQGVPVDDTRAAVEGEKAVLAFTPTPTVAPSSTPSPTATPRPEGTLRSGPVNLRSGPGSSYPAIGTVETGAVLEITGRRDDNLWFRVKLPSGQQGWLAAPQLDLRGNLNTVPVITPAPQPAATRSAAKPTTAPVLVACLDGYVRDAAGSVPLPSWVVTLTDTTGQSRATRSNFTGAYRFTGLTPGVYTVAVTVQGGWQSLSPTSQTVTISAAQTCVAVDFWAQRAITETIR